MTYTVTSSYSMYVFCTVIQTQYTKSFIYNKIDDILTVRTRRYCYKHVMQNLSSTNIQSKQV